MDPDRLTVTRWRRFGHDRLYVRFDGAEVGWWDLLTGEPHPYTPYFLPALYTARANWQSGGQVPQPAAIQHHVPLTYPRLDRDLANREPAAGLLERVAALERVASASAAFARPVVPPRPSPLRRFLAWLRGADAVAAGQTAPTPAARSWLIGAAGEQRVGEILRSLTRFNPYWQSLHSIPIDPRGWDIDHLVMGPGGIFTINTKHHPRSRVWVGGDVVLVNGRARSYVGKSLREAAHASQVLSMACGFPVHVQALVVTVGAKLTVKNAPGRVTVLQAETLAGWLAARPVTLPVPTLGHAYAAARRESTWMGPHIHAGSTCRDAARDRSDPVGEAAAAPSQPAASAD